MLFNILTCKSKVHDPSPETTTSPVLPEYRRPMSFYSQAEVDSHYRRVLAHNETKKDQEFENDSELLQWYVHVYTNSTKTCVSK